MIYLEAMVVRGAPSHGPRPYDLKVERPKRSAGCHHGQSYSYHFEHNTFLLAKGHADAKPSGGHHTGLVNAGSQS